MATPPLGWIAPQDRTQQQTEAHEKALAMMPRFALAPPSIPKGSKVLLTDVWKDPTVMADIGCEFTGFHQLTGSCFPAGTMVRTPYNGEKSIELVEAGEVVKTHKGHTRKVITPTSREYSGRMVTLQLMDGAGRKVTATADHQFLTPSGEWVEAGKLQPNAEIIFNGEPRKLTAFPVSLEVTGEKVHCLKVEEDESFVANGFTVHNCVGASEGNAVFTLGGIQRLLATNPTVAFIPWWLYPYGRTRYNEGDRGQGEGAVDSVMGETLGKEGVFDIGQAGLPKFRTDDGFYLTEQIELEWSDGARIDQKWLNLGKQFPLGSHAPLYSAADIKAALLNGYPVLDGCNNYVGNGHITGSGDNAYVTGQYDGRGGHSTCFLGYWEHPNDGPLYLYSNQWPSQTYPKDPAGGGRCCVWLPESQVDELFRNGGGDGETMALSHLTWLPAQPKVLDLWLI